MFKSQEEKDKFIEKMVEEIKIKVKLKEDFIKEKQNIIMDLIYNFLENETVIDNTDIQYKAEHYPFTLLDFTTLFDVLLKYAENRNLFEVDEKNKFPHYIFHMQYKNLDITARIMFGQGTSMQMWKSENEIKNKFNYNEYKEYSKTAKVELY